MAPNLTVSLNIFKFAHGDVPDIALKLFKLLLLENVIPETPG
jgi:hypothetical protein